jgi:hypothetical protein
MEGAMALLREGVVGGVVPAPLPAPARVPVELALERRVVLEARRAVEAAGLATAFAAGGWDAAAGRALGAAADGVEVAAAAAAAGVEVAAAAAGADLAATAPLVVGLGVGVAMAQEYGGWSNDKSIGQRATRTA